MRTLSCCILSKDDDPTEAVRSMRPFVDEVVLVWTCEEDSPRAPVEGVDAVFFFNACNAERDCSPFSPCQCKAGDILDFALARNYARDRASGDLITTIDSDDIVVGTGSLRDLYKDSVRVLSPYEYGYDVRGVCNTRLYVDRVATRSQTWEQPIHEVLDFPRTSLVERNDTFVWKHQRTKRGIDRSRARGLRMTRHWEFHPKWRHDPRFLYHLGRTHLDCNLRERAAVAMEYAFALETFVDQKAIIALDIARCYPTGLALPWAYRALELRPEWPRPWLLLAHLYEALARQNIQPEKNSRLARQFRDGGLACEAPRTVLSVDPGEMKRALQTPS